MKQRFIIEAKKTITSQELLGCLEDTINNKIISVEEKPIKRNDWNKLDIFLEKKTVDNLNRIRIVKSLESFDQVIDWLLRRATPNKKRKLCERDKDWLQERINNSKYADYIIDWIEKDKMEFEK